MTFPSRFGRELQDGGAKYTTRELALICATLTHGLANFAEDATPAGSRKVVDTADLFEKYLLSGKETVTNGN